MLRDEFRLLKDGIKIKRTLDVQVLSNTWLAPAVVKQIPGTDLLSGSASDQPSPCKSSNPLHSSAESETTQADEPNKSKMLVQRPTKCRSDECGDSLDGDRLPQTSRKGHRKSREGCFNCKRRKIKVCNWLKTSPCLTESQCQETQPACPNCTKKNLICSYPAPRTLKSLQGSLLYSSNPIASVNLQGTPTIFTLADLRLFHHFLTDAYPHLPVGNDSVWLSQVPLIAHHVSCDLLFRHLTINYSCTERVSNARYPWPVSFPFRASYWRIIWYHSNLSSIACSARIKSLTF